MQLTQYESSLTLTPAVILKGTIDMPGKIITLNIDKCRHLFYTCQFKINLKNLYFPYD